jgi:hypothetical protein
MLILRLCFVGALLILLMSARVYGQDSTRVLATKEMVQLLPDYIKGFQKSGEPVSKVIKVGGLQYSLCDKRFLKGVQRIKFLLFDFKEAPIMYSQAIKKWSLTAPVVTDSLVQRPLIIEGCEGWETFNQSMMSSQIFLGIHHRFFLTIEGESVELDKLKEVLQAVEFINFPR